MQSTDIFGFDLLSEKRHMVEDLCTSDDKQVRNKTWKCALFLSLTSYKAWFPNPQIWAETFPFHSTKLESNL